ncbi:hypothetical protein Ancab_006313 [Ancistrocladus abbreviatus]
MSLAYQISTIQFENMQPIGVGLLSTIIDKFEAVEDPELPGHHLLEQYQAQLVSALRSALAKSSGPILLEAGLQLATKMLTSGVIRGDQVAVRRIFSLISRPLDEFKELYYPSFAEWVSCKIKIRLLAAHASLKCYTYTFLRRHHTDVPVESLALLPLFSKSSNVLGKYWIGTLKDYCNICFNLHSQKNWKPFLEGIQSPLVSSKLKLCLEDSWPVILPAVVLDAAPVEANLNTSYGRADENILKEDFISGYSMVELESEEFRFLWGLASLVLFQGHNPTTDQEILPLGIVKAKFGDSVVEETKAPSVKAYEVALPVFQFLCTKRFFNAGFLTVDICRELLQVFAYVGCKGDSWNSLAVAVLAQIVQNCPEDFLRSESLAHLTMELCLAYLFKMFDSTDAASPDGLGREDLIAKLFVIARTLLDRFEPQRQLKSTLAFVLIGYHCIRGASTESCFAKINDFVLSTSALLKMFIDDKSDLEDTIIQLQMIIGACQNAIANLMKDCIEAIHLLENRPSSMRRIVHRKLAFCLEQTLLLSSLVYKIELLQGDKCINSINMSIFTECTKCVEIVLIDSSIQVQAIALQVLKNTLQKKAAVKGDSFVVILTGELFEDILAVVQKELNKPLSKESAALIGECLKTLMLMQAVPKGEDCQKGLMNLLLEAIVLVLARTENSLSQELSEIRSTAVRLVSHLAQIPSAVLHLKDVLIRMPPMHRQQIQGIIRASVSQEHETAQAKAGTLTLQIKLPLQTEGNRTKNSPAPATAAQLDADGEDEEDDWDAFQSFPASANVTAVGPEHGQEEQLPIENSSISELSSQNDVQPLYSSSSKEIINENHQDCAIVEAMNDSLSNRDEAGLEDSGATDGSLRPSDTYLPKSKDQEHAPASSDTIQAIDDVKGSVEVYLTDNDLTKESQGGSDDFRVSSDSSPVVELSNLQISGEGDCIAMIEESSSRDSELRASTGNDNIDQHQESFYSSASSRSQENLEPEQHLEADEDNGKQTLVSESDNHPEHQEIVGVTHSPTEQDVVRNLEESFGTHEDSVEQAPQKSNSHHQVTSDSSDSSNNQDDRCHYVVEQRSDSSEETSLEMKAKKEICGRSEEASAGDLSKCKVDIAKTG